MKVRPAKQKRQRLKMVAFRFPQDVRDFLDRESAKGFKKTELIVSALRKTYGIK